MKLNRRFRDFMTDERVSRTVLFRRVDGQGVVVVFERVPEGVYRALTEGRREYETSITAPPCSEDACDCPGCSA